MTTREEALKYGLSFPDTYQDAPFHDDNWRLVRFKGNKKAFFRLDVLRLTHRLPLRRETVRWPVP